jgi:hypothetical protein
MTQTLTQTASNPPTPQRLRALERANSVRLARADLKRKIADGETSAAAIILGCPGEVQRWTVAELLVSQRRWGAARCRKFLQSVQISEIKLIGDLTDRQRRLLVTALGGCPEMLTNGAVDQPAMVHRVPAQNGASGNGAPLAPLARELTYA